MELVGSDLHKESDNKQEDKAVENNIYTEHEEKKEDAQKKEPANGKDFEKTEEKIKPENRGLFNKLSSAGKDVVSFLYKETKTEVVDTTNKVINKMGIAYNQFWVDRKTKKATELHEQMKEIDKKLAPEEGKKIDPSLKRSLENKKEKLQSRIERRDNQIKIFSNRRDTIADRLITNYENKLLPIEASLEALERERSKKEIVCISFEAEIDNLYDLVNLKKEELTQKYGDLSETKIKDERKEKKEEIQKIKDEIEECFFKIKMSKSMVAAKREEINKKISASNKRAEPYRRKINKFIRIKSNRPEDLDLKERETPKEFRSAEQTKNHERIKNSPRYSYQEDTIETPAIIESNDSYLEKKKESSKIIDDYNKYLEKQKGAKPSLQIVKHDLLTLTTLSEKSKISVKNFIEIIKEYYKTLKIKEVDYFNIVNAFKK